ncbi:hypothetical protein G5B38_19225 (plasmid) [Pseudohalocynthiibacter aestuariivivens]|nr:hypothetical protein [Pseudohalocynthiibacter aestuariivivens]QIE47755.1 hypothetical protein G5B38_19225 [Pseudohalocynthiibacter aestuariivivens]
MVQWFLIGLACLAPLPALSDAVIANWDIEHLGWNNGKDLAAVAEVASRFDLLAVQEVMSEEIPYALEAALEARTGAEWDTLQSHAVGRGSYKEFYAFLYRPDTITWVDGAVVFARKPFSARSGCGSARTRRA